MSRIFPRVSSATPCVIVPRASSAALRKSACSTLPGNVADHFDVLRAERGFLVEQMEFAMRSARRSLWRLECEQLLVEFAASVKRSENPKTLAICASVAPRRLVEQAMHALML